MSSNQAYYNTEMMENGNGGGDDRQISISPYKNTHISDPMFQELLKNEGVYRSWLQQTFQPLFAPYEGEGGMPVNQLKQVLQEGAYRLPSHKMEKFMITMDKNKNGRITFEEFYDSMIRRRKEDLGRGTQFFLTTILAVSPNIQLEERRRNKKKLLGADRMDGFYGPEKSAKLDDEIPDSYLEAYNCRPPPIFIPICVVAQIVVFIIYALEIQKKNERNNQLTWTSGVPYWSPLIFNPRCREQAWRFVSYMLVHQGIHHILFNCLMLIILGIPLEIVHKCWRVGPVFILGVLGGSLASSVADNQVSVCGSSGGVYSMMGAHIALVIMNWEELQHEWLNFRRNPLAFFSSGVFRIIILVILIGLDFGVVLYQAYGLQETTNISIVDHCGGLATGILLGIPILRNLEVKKWEKVIFWVALGIWAALFITAVLFNIFYKAYPTQPPC